MRLELEMAFSDFSDDLFICEAVERRNTRENDEGDDSYRPKVAFMSVLLCKNFWGDIVRSTHLLLKVPLCTKLSRKPEIYNFDLAEMFVGLEQDVFWLEISMHHILRMAVVDASQHLL